MKVNVALKAAEEHPPPRPAHALLRRETNAEELVDVIATDAALYKLVGVLVATETVIKMVAE